MNDGCASCCGCVGTWNGDACWSFGLFLCRRRRRRFSLGPAAARTCTFDKRCRRLGSEKNNLAIIDREGGAAGDAVVPLDVTPARSRSFNFVLIACAGW